MVHSFKHWQSNTTMKGNMPFLLNQILKVTNEITTATKPSNYILRFPKTGILCTSASEPGFGKHVLRLGFGLQLPDLHHIQEFLKVN